MTETGRLDLCELCKTFSTFWECLGLLLDDLKLVISNGNK